MRPRSSNNRTRGWEMMARLEIWDAGKKCFFILMQEFAGYTGERRRLWGCACLKRSGTWWLPQLGSMNLIVSSESLDTLRRECVLALDMSDELSAESGCSETTIRATLQNLILLIDEGQNVGGSIHINGADFRDSQELNATYFPDAE